jgi:hypothetical protein
MNENEITASILRDLAMLATENADVREGNLSNEEYRKHCELVEQRIETAFPAQPSK